MNRPTSLYLDLIRPLAAILVLFSHVGSLTDGNFQFFSAGGVQAVDIFFVLSGFVIAHVYGTKEKDVRSYSISRADRIYSVVVPALILTAVADAIGTKLDPDKYQTWVHEEALAPKLVIRSLLFLGEQWNSHRIPGTNGPYWSLGYEVWYYIAFGAFVFSPSGWRWLGGLMVLLFIGPKVVLMFPMWLMGVAAYRICKTRMLPKPFGWLSLTASLALFTAYQLLPIPLVQQFYNVNDSLRLIGLAQHYFIAAFFAAHLIGFSTVSEVFGPTLDRCASAIRWIAGSTFSIYLAHLPIMRLLTASSPWPHHSMATLILLLTITPLLCFLFAEVSERRKELWRKSFGLLWPPPLAPAI
jgi:peptidoglycan/LPS O-acetylase OafA/YrhL